MKSIIRKHLANCQHLHDECINETLLAVWYNIEKYSGPNNFKNWLAAITRYKAIDCKRQYLKVVEREVLNHPGEHFDNERTLLKNELSEEIEDLLAYLTPEDRELFKKYYLENEDMRTLEKEAGIKSSVIYNRLSRGRKKIRALWSEHKA